MADEDLCVALERLFWQDSFSPQDAANWTAAVETYVKESNLLDLYGCEMGEEWDGNKLLEPVIKLLSNSETNKLALYNFNLQDGGMRSFCQLNKIKETKIDSLDVRDCKISFDDFLALAAILTGKKVAEFDVKDSHTQIVFISNDISFVYQRLTSTVKQLSIYNSSPKTLDLTHIICVDENRTLILTEGLSGSATSTVSLVGLFSKLKFSTITDLNLTANQITISKLKILSENLKDLNLEKLNLSSNDISDAGIDVLAQGLIGSKVIELDLSGNTFSGLNDLGRHLVRTNVTRLELGSNETVKNAKMFAFPKYLKNSSLVTLDISESRIGDELGQKLMKSLKRSAVKNLLVRDNELGPLSISEFANNIKDMNVENIDLSYNSLSSESFVVFSECLIESKIKHIDVSGCCEPKFFIRLFYLVEKTKSFPLTSLIMGDTGLSGSSCKLLCQVLKNTKFRCFTTSNCNFKKCAASLADSLRFTAITHLVLNDVKLEDKGVEALAKSLNGSKIFELGISGNEITSKGAQALANELKGSSLLYLDLSENLIENDGFEALAKHAEGTLIISINVWDNPGDRVLIIDTVMWQNRVVHHKLETCFKQIAPEENDQTFRFHCLADGNFSEIFDECLQFYKIIAERPSAISALSNEKSNYAKSFTTSKLSSLFSDFPRQFALFIRTRVEASVEDHVNVLEKADELELSSIVESLLLHRPLYMIDENMTILHPRVYKLLQKHKLPICNLDVEPEGKSRIRKYFTDHADLLGAEDVIKLLESDSVM